MEKIAYKMNINQFISLCVENNTYYQIFSPFGFSLAVVSSNIEIKNHNGTTTLLTNGNSQIEHGQIIIISI